MTGQSNQSMCYGETSSNPTHRYSTADSTTTTTRRRQSSFENQPISQDGSAYRVSYQGTDVRASEAQHRERIQAEMARIMGQSSGRR
ncbi:hypothetical protein CPLU01_08461 [Colletotrichum plurivorum]|uniref:Uncharacterized protein n=1 Tax=Colletotrichum plurivorum TaxID=2175906 RepID=A0A8H6KBM8_9PEZI|nr:hypothetical protein CPLU01_08461 [Colletotrichum plurivorum]